MYQVLLFKFGRHLCKGSIRSRSQWYNEGEKNSAYFLSLEKRHCKQGTISQLKINDTECTAFYKNLYMSKNPTASSQHSSLKRTSLP